jgi:GTPase SAR1 family protein
VRPLSYQGSDLIFIHYSVMNLNSLLNAKGKWLEEIRDIISKDVKFFLIGNKIDLREDENEIEKVKKNNESIVSFEEGLKFSKEVNADGFFECSALKGIGVKEIFENAIKFKFGTNEKDKNDTETKNGSCLLM